jgi:hypothetical protein
MSKPSAVLASVLAVGLAIPSPALGEPIIHELNTPFAITIANSCTGETVYVEGTINTTVQVTVTSSGAFHNKVHNASKGHGLGIPSYDRYVYSEEMDSELTTSGAATETQTMNHVLTSASSSDDLYLKMTFHLTVNGLGVPTASVDHFESGCRG